MTMQQHMAEVLALFPGVSEGTYESDDPNKLAECLLLQGVDLKVYVWASIYPEYPNDGYWAEMSERGIFGLSHAARFGKSQRRPPVSRIPFSAHFTTTGRVTVWIGVDWEKEGDDPAVLL